MVPLTAVETTTLAGFWAMAAASGIEREKMLIFTPDLPGKLTGTYGLVGASIFRIARTEGETNIGPGEIDRLGNLLENHLGKGSGRAVVLGGMEMLIDSSSLKSVRRLLQVAREVAETTRGAVLYALNPEILSQSERRQLEEGATVLRLPPPPPTA